MLEVKQLTKHYGSFTALDHLSFTVKQGETCVIMGPSGCGKSTTIRAINRLVEPDGGQVLFKNIDLLTLSEEELRQNRKKIGFVFQHFNLISRLSALENVMLPLVMAGCLREEAQEKALTSLDRVGLKQQAALKPEELSGGQQQRVAIARALSLEPELMLWDEPTASLDPMLVQEVLVIMEELAAQQECTMIVVTHEIPFALRAADRILLMDQGRLVEEGSPDHIFRAPTSEIGQRYRKLLEYQRTLSPLEPLQGR